MDRKQWLTMVYREANLLLERHSEPDHELTAEDIQALEPELHAQIQEVLSSVDSLEDLIKFSLLKNPSPDLWYGENSWPHVLVAVASSCLLHDIQGITLKILDGTLPRTDSTKLMAPLEDGAPHAPSASNEEENEEEEDEE